MNGIKQYKNTIRKTANWLIGVNASLLAISVILLFTCSYSVQERWSYFPEYFMSDIAHISVMSLIIGIYLKGSYRYIWTQCDYHWGRVAAVVAIPTILFMYEVIFEFLRPSMAGPMEWAVRDIYAWFGNWRLNWIMTFLQRSLCHAILIIYVIVFIRGLYMFYLHRFKRS